MLVGENELGQAHVVGGFTENLSAIRRYFDAVDGLRSMFNKKAAQLTETFGSPDSGMRYVAKLRDQLFSPPVENKQGMERRHP